MDLDTIRRVISVTLITIDVTLVGVFYTYAYVHFDKAWRENLPVHASLALGTYFSGRLITQIWAWILLVIPAHSDFIEVPTGLSLFVALLGTAVTIVGAAWTSYVFTPPAWRVKGWIAAIIVTGLFIALTWNLNG